MTLPLGTPDEPDEEIIIREFHSPEYCESTGP